VRAVLWCNAAACGLKLGRWREGADAATRAVESLDKAGAEEVGGVAGEGGGAGLPLAG
jgi:hypothetical protein